MQQGIELKKAERKRKRAENEAKYLEKEKEKEQKRQLARQKLLDQERQTLQAKSDAQKAMIDAQNKQNELRGAQLANANELLAQRTQILTTDAKNQDANAEQRVVSDRETDRLIHEYNILQGKTQSEFMKIDKLYIDNRVKQINRELKSLEMKKEYSQEEKELHDRLLAEKAQLEKYRNSTELGEAHLTTQQQAFQLQLQQQTVKNQIQENKLQMQIFEDKMTLEAEKLKLFESLKDEYVNLAIAEKQLEDSQNALAHTQNNVEIQKQLLDVKRERQMAENKIAGLLVSAKLPKKEQTAYLNAISSLAQLRNEEAHFAYRELDLLEIEKQETLNTYHDLEDQFDVLAGKFGLSSKQEVDLISLSDSYLITEQSEMMLVQQNKSRGLKKLQKTKADIEKQIGAILGETATAEDIKEFIENRKKSVELQYKNAELNAKINTIRNEKGLQIVQPTVLPPRQQTAEQVVADYAEENKDEIASQPTIDQNYIDNKVDEQTALVENAENSLQLEADSEASKNQALNDLLNSLQKSQAVLNEAVKENDVSALVEESVEVESPANTELEMAIDAPHEIVEAEVVDESKSIDDSNDFEYYQNYNDQSTENDNTDENALGEEVFEPEQPQTEQQIDETQQADESLVESQQEQSYEDAEYENTDIAELNNAIAESNEESNNVEDFEDEMEDESVFEEPSAVVEDPYKKDYLSEKDQQRIYEIVSRLDDIGPMISDIMFNDPIRETINNKLDDLGMTFDIDPMCDRKKFMDIETAYSLDSNYPIDQELQKLLQGKASQDEIDELISLTKDHAIDFRERAEKVHALSDEENKLFAEAHAIDPNFKYIRKEVVDEDTQELIEDEVEEEVSNVIESPAEDQTIQPEQATPVQQATPEVVEPQEVEPTVEYVPYAENYNVNPQSTSDSDDTNDSSAAVNNVSEVAQPVVEHEEIAEPLQPVQPATENIVQENNAPSAQPEAAAQPEEQGESAAPQEKKEAVMPKIKGEKGKASGHPLLLFLTLASFVATIIFPLPIMNLITTVLMAVAFATTFLDIKPWAWTKSAYERIKGNSKDREERQTRKEKQLANLLTKENKHKKDLEIAQIRLTNLTAEKQRILNNPTLSDRKKRAIIADLDAKINGAVYTRDFNKLKLEGIEAEKRNIEASQDLYAYRVELNTSKQENKLKTKFENEKIKELEATRDAIVKQRDLLLNEQKSLVKQMKKASNSKQMDLIAQRLDAVEANLDSINSPTGKLAEVQKQLDLVKQDFIQKQVDRGQSIDELKVDIKELKEDIKEDKDLASEAKSFVDAKDFAENAEFGFENFTLSDDDDNIYGTDQTVGDSQQQNTVPTDLGQSTGPQRDNERDL